MLRMVIGETVFEGKSALELVKKVQDANWMKLNNGDVLTVQMVIQNYIISEGMDFPSYVLTEKDADDILEWLEAVQNEFDFDYVVFNGNLIVRERSGFGWETLLETSNYAEAKEHLEYISSGLDLEGIVQLVDSKNKVIRQIFEF